MIAIRRAGCAAALAVVVGGEAGCRSPGGRRAEVEVEAPARGPGPDESGMIRVASPRERTAPGLVAAPSAVETWLVHTRACEEFGASDPWPSLVVGRPGDDGGPLSPAEPEELLGRMEGRPVVVLVHGNAYTYERSLKEGLEIRAMLEALGGFAPDAVFILFDWPSERLGNALARDLNEKARRSRVAGYHLARFLQAAPPGARACLMGQSDGGRVVLTAAHLLSGAEVRGFVGEPPLQLNTGRSDLRLRCVTLEAAAGHHWLNPGERLDQALPMSEALLNLHNPGDYALAAYVLGRYTGMRPALGSVGLTHGDRKRLGELAGKVEEINHHEESGRRHTSFPEALGFPEVGPRIAAYSSWGDLGSRR